MGDTTSRSLTILEQDKAELREVFLGSIRVTTDGCWEWTAGTLNRETYNYGRMRYKGRRLLTHRISYALFHGPVPTGLCVCHVCDNPICVNPHHLFMSTQAGNILDAARKGRMAHGSTHSKAKLSDADVIRIRKHTGNMSALSRELGVSRQAVHQIRHNRIRRLG